jgi:hypothetical protein
MDCVLLAGGERARQTDEEPAPNCPIGVLHGLPISLKSLSTAFKHHLAMCLQRRTSTQAASAPAGVSGPNVPC